MDRVMQLLRPRVDGSELSWGFQLCSAGRGSSHFIFRRDGSLLLRLQR